jgi:hypothetical protein
MLNKTSLELAKFILVCICRINIKFRRKLTIKVSRVPTVNDGTSNLNISIQTKHHVRFMVMGGEVRILVCSFLVSHGNIRYAQQQMRLCRAFLTVDLTKTKLTSKGLFWASTRRLHLAVRLLRSASPIGDGCDKVAHGRLFTLVECDGGSDAFRLPLTRAKWQTLNYTRASHR